MRQGIILFAHGSRDPLWRGPIEAVARAISLQAPHVLVACAYLELTAPDLTRCAADLITRGAQQLCVLPMFLGVGKHAREDLPQLIADLRHAHPEVPVMLKRAIGEDDRLLSLIATLALE